MRSFFGSFFHREKEIPLTHEVASLRSELTYLRKELEGFNWLSKQRSNIGFSGGYGSDNVTIFVHEKAPGAAITAYVCEPTFLDAVSKVRQKLEVQ
jgi:hypothetical protein